MMPCPRLLRALLVSASLAACGGDHVGPTQVVEDTTTKPNPVPTPFDLLGLHASGNKLVDGNGTTVRIRGVNHSGMEYACIQVPSGANVADGRGWGFWDPFDGTGNNDAAVAAIKGWKANVVRVPLNEDCWLGINGVKPQYGGKAYQDTVAAYVARINRSGLLAILDLHWTAPGTIPDTAQWPMPDQDHTPAFWRQVATRFVGNAQVIFDLFNEPYPDNNSDTQEAWRCWRDGGNCSGMNYRVAGMQMLVDTVRATGATNLIMLGGVQYASSLSQWLAFKPTDPLNNLAASWHVYVGSGFHSGCSTSDCWNGAPAAVAGAVPLILGEVGQSDGSTDVEAQLLEWMDTRGASYLAWTWNTWGPPLSLISNYDGTASTYGQFFKSRLAQ